MIDKNIVVLDTETTGTSITQSRIVQYSAIKVDGNFNVVDPLKTILINPLLPIPAEATQVHKITDEMVKDKPTFKAYAKALADHLKGCILAGFNLIDFDIPLLSEEFHRAGIKWPEEDLTIIDCHNIFKFKERRDLAAAHLFYTGEVLEGAHDAGVDVMGTMRVLEGQLRKYEDLREMDASGIYLFCTGGKKPVDIAGKILYGPNGEPVYGFGKDAGKTIKNNPGFGEWMLKQDFCTDTKNHIKKLIL